jgi:uncharacterized DUF497 family protein
MDYEWDEKKRTANLEKHGLDFLRAAEMLAGDTLLIVRDDRHDYGEERFIAYGRLGQRVCVAVYAKRKPDAIRLISFRKANRREVIFYEATLPQ